VFEKADTLASQEYFGGIKKVWHKSDYDTEMKIVKFNGSEFSLHHKRRIPETYFTPYCPVEPRIKLNQ